MDWLRKKIFKSGVGLWGTGLGGESFDKKVDPTTGTLLTVPLELVKASLVQMWDWVENRPFLCQPACPGF